MDLLHDLLLFLHLLGVAAIVGSAVFVARGRVTPALLWGARAQLVTGLLLVAVAQADDDPVNNAKVGVKLVVALAVVACAEIASARSKRGDLVPNLVNAAGALALVNTAVAVFW
ncbi:MAG TPA: hypothetical protein VFJ22_09760 [Dermatophilaceae bacterium]|jgi:hypothetical protein|nr:hypothetical protein [Dermatophilaceae bacterium]